MKKISSGKYYSAFARPRKGSDKAQLIILRKDTHELESATTVDTQDLETTAKSSINSLKKPLDWKVPHRVCLYYFLKIKRKKEEFSMKLLSDSLSKRQVVSEIKRFETYQYFLLKRLHELSTSEKVMLLTPAEKEYAPKSTEDIDLLQARDELFGLLFEKNKEMSLAHAKTTSIIKKIKAS